MIRRIEELLKAQFLDQGTTYILTGLHGMTDWGTHGGGSATETQTPFIAWGAGIKRTGKKGQHINISQCDIAVLVATLLGIPIPTRSLVSSIFINCKFI